MHADRFCRLFVVPLIDTIKVITIEFQIFTQTEIEHNVFPVNEIK